MLILTAIVLFARSATSTAPTHVIANTRSGTTIIYEKIVNPNALKVYEAELDYPVGVNATYNCGQGNFYKGSKASTWIKKAVSDLQEKYGFAPLEDRPYWCLVEYTLYSVRMDVDRPAKAIIDAVARAFSIADTSGNRTKYIGFNDKWVGHVDGSKELVDHYSEQALTVKVYLGKVKDKSQFRSVERQYRQQRNLEDLKGILPW